ncbi:hypothetical protein IGB42_02998 [Andreprevotia sp. IGB-42]|uniref:hypothetical protein n=1 Tax=Andreprevotia sp. IGB-42 TaxID=2497473 RepID=UPI00135BB6B0|nr:hypothetical protein [Andreprevotia sp. IGB-42]KAF0812706.1 hypothetical protein IGB42_02998 [Andreprevotia sp. IGB-42]
MASFKPWPFYSAIIVLPVKWAAGFVDAGCSDFISSFVAVALGAVAAGVVDTVVGGGLGVLLAFAMMNLLQMLILKVPAGSVFGFFFIAIFLQLAVGFAIAIMPSGLLQG